MRSASGNYSTTIRKRKDGAYNIELFAVYPGGLRMGINGHEGVPTLDEARKISRDWMLEYERQDDGDEL